MVRYLSALFATEPSSRSGAPQPDETGRDGDFLKLDNDVSISRERIDIGTVLYDRSSNPARAGSWLTRIFSFIKEWRAARWVETFVGTRLKHLPGSAEFVTHIRRQGGVRRHEFVDFLLEQRLTGLSADWLGAGANKSFGDYQIADVGNAIQSRLSSALGPEVSDKQFEAFFGFIDSGCLDVPQHRRKEALAFVQNFRAFATTQAQHPLVAVMQGKVNLLDARLDEDREFFESCKALLKRLHESDGPVIRLDGKPGDWVEFIKAVKAGARGETEYHPESEHLQPLNYADSFISAAHSNEAGTRRPNWPDRAFLSLVETVYRRYTLRESRSEICSVKFKIFHALACSARGHNAAPGDASTMALETFFGYCMRGPAFISPRTIGDLKKVTEAAVKKFCEEKFKDEASDIATWADNLFICLQEDLAVFEGLPSPPSPPQ